MTSVTSAKRGGVFLLENAAPEAVFTPEDLTPEHRAIAKTTDQFWARDIAPRLDAIRHQEYPVAVGILKKSAAAGLLGVLIPEQFGGMGMDLASTMIVAEGVARDGSYAAWHGAHAGIGTLPVLLFGTEAQKHRYLPLLASAEMIAAYCLSEPQAGSDALAARTRADLSPDGTHYLLNGQKMWITNGGFADLFTVFAKIGGEKFTAFLVERAWPGVSTGAEEHKMGLKGSSTTAVYFDSVQVPVENVLGEIGRGHIIAFNILNLGRLMLGAFAQGGCREALSLSIRYARDRKAFGKAIAEFGLIQHKLAEMAIRMYASESMLYRVTGDIDGAGPLLQAAEEFAIESSLVKIFASEALDYVVDEGVQIHGGYGFHHDYAIEHAYRDARVDRIFEGTNEINRLLATGMLLKRAQRGVLPLALAVKKLTPEPGVDVIENAKKIGLFILGAAFQKYQGAIEEQQEIVAAIADILMNCYALESALVRARKCGRENANDMATVFASEAMEAIHTAARTVAAACSESDALCANLAVLQRLASLEPVNTIGLRRRISARLIQRGHYLV